ncbi:hypothetical protein D3C71_1362290 [compost metagenome]
MEIIFQYCTQHFTGQMIDLSVAHPLHTVTLDKAPDLFLAYKLKDFRHCLLNDLGDLQIVLWVGKPLANR